MLVKFNPTGTHTKGGFLKIRLDLYPEPTDKTYSIHYVDKPDRPYTEEELEDEALQASVPKHKELNPCLCHFIKVDTDISLDNLVHYVKHILDKDTVSQLDDALSRLDTVKVSRIMRNKLGDGGKVPKFIDEDRDNLNARLSSEAIWRYGG